MDSSLVSFDDIIDTTVVDIDAVEENLEVFVNVEEDTVEEVFGNVVNLASASVEEETGVKT